MKWWNDHLNAVLAADGFEVMEIGGKARLRPLGSASAAVAAIAVKSAAIDFDTVRHEIDRALEAAERDPEDAITAACSMLEAVCRSILIELGQELPEKKDIQGLVKGKRPGPPPCLDQERRIVSALDSGHYGAFRWRVEASGSGPWRRSGRSVSRRRRPVFPWLRWRGATR